MIKEEMLIFRIAFRNIFRHFWRSAIIVLSILLVFLVLVFVQSQKKGTHRHIVQHNIFSYTGTAQISPKNQEKTIFYKEFLQKNHTCFPKNTFFAPRIIQWAWGNIGTSQKPIQIIGISPKDEHNFGSLFKKIRFLDKKNAFIGEKFKEKEVKINDTIWINTQNKTDFFIVKGFFSFPNPILNENAIIIPLHNAQNLYNLENQCNFLGVITNDKKEFSDIFTKKIKNQLQNQAKFLVWQEAMPDIAQMLWLDKAGFGVLMVILCLVLGLGLAGSVIILGYERKKEFVQLYELGVDKFFLIKWVLFEWFLVVVLGICCGFLLAIPILYYFSKTPILLGGDIAQSLREIGFSAEIHFAFDAQIFISPVIMILILGILLALVLRNLVMRAFF